MKILGAADIHLGRRPGRLPSSLTDRIPARALGPAGAWERLIDLAIEEEVHALLLAGDVVDGEQDFFEAHAQLHRGVARLAEAGVRVLAVAGNHDTKVLPYLANEVEAFELIGRNGEWEAVTVTAGDDQCTVWGWSFPQRIVRNSPLLGAQFVGDEGVNFGLLHCDLDSEGSPYAPTSSRSLDDLGLDAWLLGHIHVPTALEAPHPVGYLGSLTGLDAGEHGVRGAWLFEVRERRIAKVCRRALAPLRWVRLTIELHGEESPEDARHLVLEELRELDREVRAEPRPPRAVGVRVTLSGRAPDRRALEALFGSGAGDELTVGDGGIHYFTETVRVETLPVVDLDALARQPNPVGLLAERLLLLQRRAEDPDRRALIDRAHEELRRVDHSGRWDLLERPGPTAEDTADLLLSEGRRALDLLLAQREGE